MAEVPEWTLQSPLGLRGAASGTCYGYPHPRCSGPSCPWQKVQEALGTAGVLRGWPKGWQRCPPGLCVRLGRGWGPRGGWRPGWGHETAQRGMEWSPRGITEWGGADAMCTHVCMCACTSLPPTLLQAPNSAPILYFLAGSSLCPLGLWPCSKPFQPIHGFPRDPTPGKGGCPVPASCSCPIPCTTQGDM